MRPTSFVTAYQPPVSRKKCVNMSMTEVSKAGEAAQVEMMGDGLIAFTQEGQTVVLHIDDLRGVVSNYTKSPGKLVARG